ncbi:hypothetical protein ACFRU3_48910 [Streptomyces sp. NPDC056910]
MVTHQLENIKVADRIAVMEHGRIIVVGRNDDLAETGGLLADLLSLAKDR